jgi:hypothetical protein
MENLSSSEPQLCQKYMVETSVIPMSARWQLAK